MNILFCYFDYYLSDNLYIVFFLFLSLTSKLGMQIVWSRRNEFQITESVQYYFNKIDIIKMKNYLPDKVSFF